MLEGATCGPNSIRDIDPDEAYALQLQQEEYSRESLIPVHHPYFQFASEAYDESAGATANPPTFDSDDQQIMNDQQFAAYVQAQEEQNRQRHHVPFPFRQRPNPVSTQTSQSGDSEDIPASPFARYGGRQQSFNEDDSDEDNQNSHQLHNHNDILRALAHFNGNLPQGLEFLRRMGVHPPRRSENLQDTEEDFGPEDYEVI
jgi:hypothetical protein